MQQHYEVPGAGHYGIFSGRRWRELVYPKVKGFIKSYQSQSSTETPLVSIPAKAARKTRA
jgi:poly(3-hydroxybutyrate) depolymerase